MYERASKKMDRSQMLRRADVERLKPHIEAYEHGFRADIRGLYEAFESLERKEFRECDSHRAYLIEEILSMFGLIYIGLSGRLRTFCH